MLHPITYTIKHKTARGEVVGERHDSMTIVPRIHELSGRSLGVDAYSLGEYIVAQLRRKDRSYVATAKDSPGRRLYGKGFIVERER